MLSAMRVYLMILCLAATLFSAKAQTASNSTSSMGMSALTPTSSLMWANTNYILDDKHILAPGDRVSLRILEDRDPPVSLVVADSRELDVPYVGRVSVADKTCKTAAAEIKVLLEKEYYYRATVILGVDLVNKVRGKVYVFGQVRNQGAIDLLFDENLTAGKAILRAGGFGDFADKKNVKVIRGGTNSVESAKQTFPINMENVFEKGKVDEDKVLEPDDFVVVGTRSLNF
jgi:polysaccharide biosynthesis/export protein